MKKRSSVSLRGLSVIFSEDELGDILAKQIEIPFAKYEVRCYALERPYGAVSGGVKVTITELPDDSAGNARRTAK